MLIGVPQESVPGETRVAATPDTVAQLIKLGHEVIVEAGAGDRSELSDDAFVEAGAHIGDTAQVWDADVVAKINAPSDEELEMLRDGSVLVGLLNPRLDPDMVGKLASRNITALAMDAVPRISRAQSMDVLSSMANIAGYRAVIEAAHRFGRFFTGQVTAAGKVPPAKVFVAGAGVAGLAAIGAAGSLGAIVRATDTRPEVAEQVESMGAEFVAVSTGEEEVSSDGYAKETSADYEAAAALMYAEQARDVDIIITTALIPGRPAPRLLTAEMVDSMKPGSVIVDMAAAQGGNVEGVVPDEVVVTDGGVTIVGYTDLAGRLPTQASQLYGTNMVNLFKLLTPEKDGHVVLDMDDVIVRGMTVVHEGELMWPPPPIQVSAAPAPVAAEPPPPPAEPKPPASPVRRYIGIGVAAGLFLSLSAVMPNAMLGHMTVFVLAVVIGFYVIGNVHHALHTPLMSVTNAISGIIVVGAITQITSDNVLVAILAAIAVLVASINVFGGFTVTQRMLGMFSKGDS